MDGESMNANIREKLKNVLLVVLVLMTVLLLYFLWGSKSLESFIFNSNENTHYEVMTSKQVILPDQIILGRGNEDYLLAGASKESLWNDEILGAFREFSKGTNILVEEITEEKYKAAMAYPSLTAVFSYNLPFADFCQQFDINQAQGYDNISSVTEICFSEGSAEGTFLYDGSKGKYYWLLGNKSTEVVKQAESIFAQEQPVIYFPLKMYLGAEGTNDTLIPVESPEGLVPVDYRIDMAAAEKDTIESLAQFYFGETLDFIRKLEESNGKIIYMYGYGQKVLVINPVEGSIEYKEEIKSAGSEPQSFFQSLDTALGYIGAHGGFKTDSGETINPYLKSAMSIDDKKNSYRFVFSFKIEKNKVFYQENLPVIIEVQDGQVSYYRRELLDFDQEQGAERSEAKRISAINMLAMNYDYILSKAGLKLEPEREETAFEDVADQIDNLYIGYLKPSAESTDQVAADKGKSLQLIPVWVVEAKGTLLYFDLYDGQPRGGTQAVQ
ncbi:hypothetical protein Ami103574_00655 [Aminipila butyrica]|uniref:Regulatory protein YycH domain-containing protein n=1 Tax=Aminipila butyrica TaxID=433296 RepID=A0A858BQW6_9FIRM|nr:two-component system activity regulator YycH [Aminipila butyrica]QIB67907.1 hypothetical protein Ami103574_00655 [Aminipila butyrica]